MIEVVRTFHVHSVTAHYRDKTCLEWREVQMMKTNLLRV
jgi:hypothetical protein